MDLTEHNRAAQRGKPEAVSVDSSGDMGFDYRVAYIHAMAVTIDYDNWFNVEEF